MASKTKADQDLKYITEIPSEVSDIEWELKNFKALVELKESLKMNFVKIDFEAGKSIGIPSKWSFFLRLDGDKIGVNLELISSPKDQKEVFARFDTLIKRNDSTDYKNLVGFDMVDMKTIAVRGRYIGTSTSLLSPETNVLTDGCLKIRLRFEIYHLHTISIGKPEDEVAKVRKLSCASSVSDDWMNVFKSGIGSDVTIIMRDKKEFKVHRLVLGARSPVFLTMFETMMKEGATGQVEIHDLSSEAMEVLLKHIYSGTLSNNWIEVAEEIVYAADKYDIPLLKSYCDYTLINACTNDTALDLLKLARLHNLTTAVKDISEYIKSNIGSILHSL